MIDFSGDILPSESIKLINKLYDRYENHRSNISNQFNTKLFDKYLKSKTEYKTDINHITNGFPLWIKENIDNLPPLSTKPASFCSNINEFNAIIKTFTDELESNFIEPINQNSLNYVINVFCIPKKDDSGNYTKYRVVRNGSWKDKNRASINEYIDNDRTSIPTLPNLVK